MHPQTTLLRAVEAVEEGRSLEAVGAVESATWLSPEAQRVPVDGEPRDYVAKARGLATSPRVVLESADYGGVALTSLWQVVAACLFRGCELWRRRPDVNMAGRRRVFV